MALVQPLNLGRRSTMLAMGGNDGYLRVRSAIDGLELLAGTHRAKHPGQQRAVETHQGPEYSRSGNVAVVDVGFSSEGAVVSVSADGSLAVWIPNGKDSQLLWTARAPRGGVNDVDVSPDNQVLAVGASGGVYLLTPHTRVWALVDSIDGESDEGFLERLRVNPGIGLGRRSNPSPKQVLFSPGGGLLAAFWSDGEIRVYSVATRERVRAMRMGGETHLAQLAFSSDGKLLAASDGNRIIYVWAMRAGAAPIALTAPRGRVQAMWFTQDGRSLVVAGYRDRYLQKLPLPATP
jgi:WD40 repeat protein